MFRVRLNGSGPTGWFGLDWIVWARLDGLGLIGYFGLDWMFWAWLTCFNSAQGLDVRGGPFRLLGLPPELRDQILGLLLSFYYTIAENTFGP